MTAQNSTFWQERFRTLFAISANPVLILSPDGIITDLNRCAEELYNLPRREAIGMNYVTEFLSPSAQQKVALEIKKVMTGQISQIFENEVITKTGNRKLLMWRAAYLKGNDSVPDQLLLYCEDITRARETERQLEESLRIIHDYKFALDQSAIVAITNTRGTITYVNDKFCEISKYSRDELVGQDHRIINSRFHPKEFFIQLWKTIASGKVWRGEIRNRAKDGSYYWVDTTIVPFLDENGRPKQYVAIRSDITDRKVAHQRIEEERARTTHAEKMASLGEMAAGIAHELGNPIASISGWMDVVSKRMRTGRITMDQLQGMVPTVKEKIDRMSKIIRGMLAYARDGSQDPFQKVNIASIINGVLEYSAYKLSKYGIDLKITGFEQACDIQCRETEIAQVLVNLVLNACDAVSTLDNKWIEVKLKRLDDGVIISIIDSGNGIPQAIREQMMNPFFTTKPQGKGTGLGLSISKTIVERHYGKLWVENDSLNTCFSVFLPYARYDSPPA